ncbi:hypothetical protein AB0M43_36365 [Longispora sp. NPDC051575]|uniref:hypothetical protein n=1 Tax=Longispora sp. NPDC051575 TaxID=3154943 RepID=UPI0034196526
MLVGVALNACAKAGDGKPLSDLEERLVGLFRVFVDSDEVAEYGRVFRQRTDASMAGILPPVAARLGSSESFTRADFASYCVGIADSVMAQPNVSTVDVSKLGEDGVVDTPAFTRACQVYGSGATLLTGPPVPADVRAVPQYVWIGANRFQMEDDSGEAGKDEIYWVGAGGTDNNEKQAFRTEEFGGVEPDYHTYGLGHRAVASGFVHEHLGLEIEAWERDNGGIFGKLQSAAQRVAEYCLDAAAIASETDNPSAGGAALFAAAAAFVGWLFGMFTNDDDIIQQREFIWDRAAAVDIAKNKRTRDYLFWGHSDGKVRLWLTLHTRCLGVIRKHNNTFAVHIPGATAGFQNIAPDAAQIALSAFSSAHITADGTAHVGDDFVLNGTRATLRTKVKQIALHHGTAAAVMADGSLHFAPKYFGMLPTGVTNAARAIITNQATGVLLTDGKLIAAISPMVPGWTTVATDVVDFAMNGDRIAVIHAGGKGQYKAGGIHADWRHLTLDGRRIAIDDNRIALINSVGEVWVTDAYGEPMERIDVPGDAEQIALSGGWLGVLTTDGTALFKDGDRHSPWDHTVPDCTTIAVY